MNPMIFFLVFSLTLVTVYTYIGWRLIKPAPIKKQYKMVAWIILLFSPLLLFLSNLFTEYMQYRKLGIICAWTGYILFGFITIVLALLLIRDLFWLITMLVKKIRQRIQSAGSKKQTVFDAERRRFLLNSMNIGILGISGVLSSYGLYEAHRRARLEKITIPLSTLPREFENFRIVQFSDLHISQTIRRPFVQSVVNQINRLKPDLIVFTGDLVDGSVAALRRDAQPLADLTAPCGTFFVTGNHEYYSGVLEWIDEVDRLGMTVLNDSFRIISKVKSDLVIAGVTDFTAKNFIPEHVSSPQQAIKGAPDKIPKILLAHQPKNIFEASAAGFDLQLSGHTHGGQYFPWHYMVTFAKPYVSGLNKHKNTWIYVNRGTGYWGPPLRLGIPSEISQITLTKS